MPEKLFCALVNPRANQTDLFVRKFLRTFALGHEGIAITDMGDAPHQFTVRAVANGDDLAFFAALERARQRVERQAGGNFRFCAVMAFQAGRGKNWLDVGVKSDAGFGRGGGQGRVRSRSDYGETEGRRNGGKQEFGRIHFNFNGRNWFGLIAFGE